MKRTEGKRMWQLPASGLVRYDDERPDCDWNVLGCIGLSGMDRFKMAVPAKMVGRKNSEDVIIRFNVKTRKWQSKKGAPLELEDPRLQDLVAKDLESKIFNFNEQMARPRMVHRVVQNFPQNYASELPFPLRVPSIGDSKRQWRRKDSGWLQDRVSSEDPDLNVDERDNIDRALSRVSKVDRPFDIVWEACERQDREPLHIVLKLPKAVRHASIFLEKAGSEPLISGRYSLSPDENLSHVAISQLMSMMLALRMYGGAEMGTVVLTAFSAEALEDAENLEPLAQVVVGQKGWIRPASEVPKLLVTEFIGRSFTGLDIYMPADFGWVKTPFR